MDNAQAPCHILLVDDEPIIASTLAPYLERSGFTVTVASDGEAALGAIEDSPPDLIVLDVLMPRTDGREVLRRMRKAGNWTPVILLTQVGSPVERAGALDEGADDYRNKPFEPYELLARIRAILDVSGQYDGSTDQTCTLAVYQLGYLSGLQWDGADWHRAHTYA